MLKIKTLVVGQLATNCYLAVDDRTNEALVIDPGDDAEYIKQAIFDAQANPKAVVATHGHFDHVLAAYDIQTSFGIPFYIDPEDSFLLKRMASSTKHFTGIVSDPIPRITPLREIGIGGLQFDILRTPGHTPGSVSLYCAPKKICFVGDLIFADGSSGRTDRVYANKVKIESSLRKILSLREDTIIFPGHGESTEIRHLAQLFNAKKPSDWS